jgi:carboxypeptidase Taq
MPGTSEQYQQYQELTQKAADLSSAAAVLGWDQETYMPPKSFPFRGRQLATLASQAHTITTSETYGNLLQELAAKEDLTYVRAHNVRLSLEDFEKARKLPEAFIDAVTQASSSCLNAWIQARQQNDFKIYAPELDKMIGLKREQAQRYGFEQHPYDALMDDYEKGATVEILDGVFDQVKATLPVLLGQIAAAPQVDDSFFNKFYPKEEQWAFSLEVLRAMGYDFEAGRQDYSEHPFTTSFSPTDVRVTTRVNEHNLASMLWSSIHEGGHALYEQGLPQTQYGMPLGAAASLGIHESQSRLWENCVGRSLPFWQHFYPRLQHRFKDQLGGVAVDAFYRGMNKVQPSLVRTEADEITYHFHVLIRYQIEKGLIEGQINTADLPAIWNEQYRHYLGVTPPDDLTGILQDVHWSHGSFGYFPTYSLGSFYAAQFFEEATKQQPQMATNIASGNYEPLLKWLREQVHHHGRKYRSEELCKQITGRGLDFSSFMNYATAKYAGIYDF